VPQRLLVSLVHVAGTYLIHIDGRDGPFSTAINCAGVSVKVNFVKSVLLLLVVFLIFNGVKFFNCD